MLRFFQQGAEGPVQFTVGGAAMGTGAGHVLEVATGTEVLAGAAQHQGTDAAPVTDRGHHRAQFGDHLQAHGIAVLRAIEADEQYAVARLQQQGLAGRERVHFFFPGRMPMSLQMIPSMISSAPPPMDTRRTSR